MANVEFCEHDWPGSGCAKCRAEREEAKLACEAAVAVVGSVAVESQIEDVELVKVGGVNLMKRGQRAGSLWALPGGFTD